MPKFILGIKTKLFKIETAVVLLHLFMYLLIYRIKVFRQKCRGNSVDPDQIVVNPLYTGGLFHCYMLDESVILGVSDIFCQFYSIFGGKSCEQTP